MSVPNVHSWPCLNQTHTVWEQQEKLPGLCYAGSGSKDLPGKGLQAYGVDLTAELSWAVYP